MGERGWTPELLERAQMLRAEREGAYRDCIAALDAAGGTSARVGADILRARFRIKDPYLEPDVSREVVAEIRLEADRLDGMPFSEHSVAKLRSWADRLEGLASRLDPDMEGDG